MYTQSLIKTITPIKPKIIKRMNRYNKWEYGYNKEYDIIVISKTGKIGEIIEIQNLVIALPEKPKEVVNTENRWVASEYPKELHNIKTVFDWETYPDNFKNKWYGYIDEEFTKRDEGGLGSIIIKLQLILLVLITCTCSGPRLMLGGQTIGKQIEFSSYFGKPVKLIVDPMECVILKIDDRDLALWLQGRPLTKLQVLQTHGLEYYQNLERMQKRCLQIKWFQYQLITRSFLNQYKTEWTAPRQNWHIESRRQSLPVNQSRQRRPERNSRGSIQPSTGRIPGTTRTTERSSGSSSTMNQGNGKDRTISSITGGSRKQR